MIYNTYEKFDFEHSTLIYEEIIIAADRRERKKIYVSTTACGKTNPLAWLKPLWIRFPTLHCRPSDTFFFLLSFESRHMAWFVVYPWVRVYVDDLYFGCI